MVSQLFIRVVRRDCNVDVVIVDHYYMEMLCIGTLKNCGPFGSVKAVRELVRAAR